MNSTSSLSRRARARRERYAAAAGNLIKSAHSAALREAAKAVLATATRYRWIRSARAIRATCTASILPSSSRIIEMLQTRHVSNSSVAEGREPLGKELGAQVPKSARAPRTRYPGTRKPTARIRRCRCYCCSRRRPRVSTGGESEKWKKCQKKKKKKSVY
jgi:hypothetical protein